MPIVDFEADIKAGLHALIPNEIEGRDAVLGMTASDAFHAYYNWMARFVEPMPRKVHRSPELNALLADHPLAADIEGVLGQIERGDDLNPRISRRVLYFRDEEHLEGPLGRRRDLDMMLADWEVHHLHLGEPKEDDFFHRRTKDLLFVSFVGDRAYAITVLPHQNWVDENVLRIMAENWPDEGVIWGLRGGISLAQEITQDDRKQLRRASIATGFQHNGRAFMPRGGLSLGGTSTLTGMEAMNHLSYIWSAKRFLDATPERLATIASAKGDQLPTETDWHLDVIDDIWRLHERRGGAVVLLQDVLAFAEAHPVDHACDRCEPTPERPKPG